MKTPTHPLPRRRLGAHRRPARARALVAASTLAAATLAPLSAARAETPSPILLGGVALNRFEPAPAGDALFGVPSPWVGGHLVPRAVGMFDLSFRPLHLVDQQQEVATLLTQGFLRADVSLALWDRLLVSADMPIAIAQTSQKREGARVSYRSPSSVELGDLRLGARGRLFGDNGAPVQLGIGGYFFAPTGTEGSFTSDGAVRGALHATLGGTTPTSTPIVWSAAAGVMLRGSGDPHLLTFGAGAALVLRRGLVQVGPEVYGSTALSSAASLAASGVRVTEEGATSAEILLGTKLRLFNNLVVGGAAGPGLSGGLGTPMFRWVLLAGWSPPLPPPAPTSKKKVIVDEDGDGVLDKDDACVDVPGKPNDDPSKDGCPLPDRDQDSVPDEEDACPGAAGDRSADPTRNGCPAGIEGDTAEATDPCDPCRLKLDMSTKRRSGSEDRDGDGISDASDACPTLAGASSDDPKRSGCPTTDLDRDGILSPDDACPEERGAPDPDPVQNGCPKFVRVTQNEIVIRKQVQFRSWGRNMSGVLDPGVAELLGEVRDVILQHPEINQIEVQGHTDNSGDNRYNLTLSQERADSIRQWLINAGVPARRITAKGYGQTVPIADNKTEEGRQKNRRVQFIILEKKPPPAK